MTHTPTNTIRASVAHAPDPRLTGGTAPGCGRPGLKSSHSDKMRRNPIQARRVSPRMSSDRAADTR